MKKRTKTLIISDLHSPFHRMKLILEILRKHAKEISLIIFAGDIVDCESISKFIAEGRKSLPEEMIETWNLLATIDALTPNIPKILIWGNHEYRFVRYLAEIDSEINDLHSKNILKEISKGFTYYDKKEKKEIEYKPLSENFTVIDNWFYQHGDAIFAHPKNFSKIPLRTVSNTLGYFLARHFKFNTLFIGHTHKWGSTSVLGKWIGELGCVCLEMEYSNSGNVNYTPQDYGYLLLAQDNGVTNINESRLYKVEVEGD